MQSARHVPTQRELTVTLLQSSTPTASMSLAWITVNVRRPFPALSNYFVRASGLLQLWILRLLQHFAFSRRFSCLILHQRYLGGSSIELLHVSQIILEHALLLYVTFVLSYSHSLQFVLKRNDMKYLCVLFDNGGTFANSSVVGVGMIQQGLQGHRKANVRSFAQHVPSPESIFLITGRTLPLIKREFQS